MRKTQWSVPCATRAHVCDAVGWCEGQLLLCDRHFDLLLSDAIEHFVSPLDRQWQQRRSDQLLLRGDGVVSVCDLQSVAARDDRAAFGALILGLDEK